MDSNKCKNKSLMSNTDETISLKLQCPFTWDMDDLDSTFDHDYSPHDEEDSFPLLKLMRHIMKVYLKTKESNDSTEILNDLKTCDEILITLKERPHPQISAEIAENVLKATKYFVFAKLKMDDECDRVFKDLKDIRTEDKIKKSTLHACKSICWSIYHRIGARRAEINIRQAIEENSKCDLWWFILGKNLRRQRRDSTIATLPSDEETDSFLKAFEISNNAFFGIFVAQMYREQREYELALRWYDKIFYLNPQSKTIQLRLALGYIHNRKFDRARICLNRVSKEYPKLSMYLHYEGIYYFKQYKYREALPYLQEAVKDANLSAEKQLLTCFVVTDKNFKCIPYLLKLLDKYKHLPEDQTQPLFLDVGFTYWKRENNLEEALKYFLKAFDINPKAICLTDYFFHKEVILIRDRNVYRVIDREFLPVIRRKSNSNELTRERVKKLQDYCNIHFNNQLDLTKDAFSKFSFAKK